MSQYMMLLRQFSRNASLYLVISGVLFTGIYAWSDGMDTSMNISQGIGDAEWMLATAESNSESTNVMDDRGSGR